jgi:hypothetical protein
MEVENVLACLDVQKVTGFFTSNSRFTIIVMQRPSASAYVFVVLENFQNYSEVKY